MFVSRILKIDVEQQQHGDPRLMSLEERRRKVGAVETGIRMSSILVKPSAGIQNAILPSNQSRLIPLMSWIIKHSWTPLMREGSSINDRVPMLFPFPTKIFNAAPEYGQPVKPEPDDYRYFGCEALVVDWRASHGNL